MIARILVASSVVALAICGVAGAQMRQTSHAVGKPIGIVHPVVNGKAVGSWATRNPGAQSGTGPTITDNLTYTGPQQSGHGPVMHTNKVYTIFWVPSGYTQPSGYSAIINQFFQDVAADSAKRTNVYASDVQYSNKDTNNVPHYIQYSSTYGGTALDTHAFPNNACTTPTDVSGTTICMSDAQLQREVKRFADSKGWPHGASTEFFLFTAHNVETCFLSDTQAVTDPGDQACSYDYYCAYHNSFTSTNGEYIYANMPYPNQTFNTGSGMTSSDCVDKAAQGFPNGGGAGPGTDGAAADEVINVTSHEHNESITDPTGDGWWVDNSVSSYPGYENGDLCAWYFPAGAVLGGSGAARYNQLIHGHHYFVQGEWSNATATASPNSGCVWAYDARPASKTAPTLAGAASEGSLLTAHAGTWTNSPTSYAYTWQRCNSSGFACSTIRTNSSASAINTYTLVAADDGHTVRVSVIAKNAHGSSAPVRSAPTATVAAAAVAPTNSARPTITGTTQSGQVLTAHAGAWANSPTSYKYEWLICSPDGATCSTIQRIHTSSGTTDTLSLTTGDVGHMMEVRVTASNAAGAGSPATSIQTSKVTS